MDDGSFIFTFDGEYNLEEILNVLEKVALVLESVELFSMISQAYNFFEW
jgi:hypothetical protein